MRRDAPTFVAKQVLAILERHTRSAQSPPKGVLQVVDPNSPKTRLHFDLFAAAASDLLAGSEALRRIICDAYPVIVLDEFQDTNAAEWRFISTLGKSSRLIAFADAQQRSYEFRGADPRRISEFVSAFDPDTFDFAGENHCSDGTCGAIVPARCQAGCRLSSSLR
ncbi:MAG TPA: UvrD-helicase domain-containing protein [Steroidobacteraceae bacterium]|nr:UvrD-helicase domain-containing protein [Steroidobacteraceae bacterium]